MRSCLATLAGGWILTFAAFAAIALHTGSGLRGACGVGVLYGTLFCSVSARLALAVIDREIRWWRGVPADDHPDDPGRRTGSGYVGYAYLNDEGPFANGNGNGNGNGT